MKIGRSILGVAVAVVLIALVAIAVERGVLGSRAPEASTTRGGSGAAPLTTEAPPAVSDAPAVPSGAADAWIDYVHDGDTLFLTDGRKVRLLGIDTPEVGEHAECWGDVARERLRAVLPEGTHVRTVADVQPLDRFGRSLLFLFTDDGALVNLDLIRDGYAEAVVLEPNVLWSDELEAAEDAAQAEGLGIWSAC